MSVLFPRLGAHLLATHLSEIINAPLEKVLHLFPEPRLEIGETYGETGGTRIRRSELTDLQRELRAIARQHGFPQPIKGGKVQQFDRRAAIHLFEKMRITAHEASQPSIWQYLCCMVVPEIVRWRFPGTSDAGTAVERFLGGRRNALGRLWWRAFVLKDDHASPDQRHLLMTSLGEDELVQLMERPAVFGDRRLVRASVAAFLAEAAVSKASRQTLMRELQKRLLRRMPVIFFGALDDDRLSAAMRVLASETSEGIAAHSAAQKPTEGARV